MNKFQLIATIILVLVGVTSIVYSVNWDKISKTVSENQKEVVYIGGDIGDGAIGYSVYKFSRHGVCYEVFRRGSDESFVIKVDCKGD
jgi:hypothetical protein